MGVAGIAVFVAVAITVAHRRAGRPPESLCRANRLRRSVAESPWRDPESRAIARRTRRHRAATRRFRGIAAHRHRIRRVQREPRRMPRDRTRDRRIARLATTPRQRHVRMERPTFGREPVGRERIAEPASQCVESRRRGGRPDPRDPGAAKGPDAVERQREGRRVAARAHRSSATHRRGSRERRRGTRRSDADFRREETCRALARPPRAPAFRARRAPPRRATTRRTGAAPRRRRLALGNRVRARRIAIARRSGKQNRATFADGAACPIDGNADVTRWRPSSCRRTARPRSSGSARSSTTGCPAPWS